jgi:hypothetical protein
VRRSIVAYDCEDVIWSKSSTLTCMSTASAIALPLPSNRPADLLPPLPRPVPAERRHIIAWIRQELTKVRRKRHRAAGTDEWVNLSPPFPMC